MPEMQMSPAEKLQIIFDEPKDRLGVETQDPGAVISSFRYASEEVWHLRTEVTNDGSVLKIELPNNDEDDIFNGAVLTLGRISDDKGDDRLMVELDGVFRGRG